MMNISFQHDTSGASGMPMAIKLACDIAENGITTCQAKINYVIGQVALWTQRAAFRSANETVDLTYVCYSMYRSVIDRHVRKAGKSFQAVSKKSFELLQSYP
jgi:hypothetical protein